MYEGLKAYELVLLALCIWREAQNQSRAGMIGVGSVILNRVKHPGWWGTTIVEVVLKKYQFSSFNKNDPNSSKMPLEGDSVWQTCLSLADGLIQGQIQGNVGDSTLYFSKPLTDPPEAWGVVTHVIDIDDLHFYHGAEPKGTV